MSYLFIGLGANLTPAGYNNPREGCEAALTALGSEGIFLEKISNWYESAPVPVSDQPWYLNAVALATTTVDAAMALAALHRIESQFGRVRGVRNGARVLDMDLLDFAGERAQNPSLTLPHPRMHERAFVLLPLRELCPDWTHPVTGVSIDDLIAQLPSCQKIRLAV
jgi:2-amino-4-hydroxy-6-hydroxymethyldihydropteridine diphosphokinase